MAESTLPKAGRSLRLSSFHQIATHLAHCTLYFDQLEEAGCDVVFTLCAAHFGAPHIAGAGGPGLTPCTCVGSADASQEKA